MWGVFWESLDGGGVNVPWWVAALTLALGALATAAVKVVPVLSKAMSERSELALKEEAERHEAALKADSAKARQKAAADQMVFEQQQQIINQLAGQIDQLSRDSNDHVHKLYEQIGALRAENDKCEERCRGLERRVQELESRARNAKGGGA